MKTNRTELAIGVALLFGVAALFIVSKPEPVAPAPAPDEKQAAAPKLTEPTGPAEGETPEPPEGELTEPAEGELTEP